MDHVPAIPLRFEDATSWMVQHGWRETSEGAAGWMWSNNQLNANVGVQRDLDADVDAQQSLVTRLARHHHLDQKLVSDAIATWQIDTAFLRAANEYVIADTIPLVAGATMLESARQMYRSAATAAIRLRANINGSYSKVGDEVLRDVRMGHTQRGSYIVPIHVRVGHAKKPDEPVIPGSETKEVVDAVESANRRTTRTFAQAIGSIEREVVRPDRAPRGEAIDRLVAHGVTREFVTAVTRTLDQSAVSSIDARFRWAGAQPAPRGVPGRVEIPAAAAPVLHEVIEELKNRRPPRQELYTGPVVVVAREPDESVTRFAIRTSSHGHPSLVEASTKEPLAVVTRWMNDRTIVQLRGTVTRTGAGLIIRTAEVALLDQMYPATDPWYDEPPF